MDEQALIVGACVDYVFKSSRKEQKEKDYVWLRQRYKPGEQGRNRPPQQ